MNENQPPSDSPVIVFQISLDPTTGTFGFGSNKPIDNITTLGLLAMTALQVFKRSEIQEAQRAALGITPGGIVVPRG